MWSNLPSIMTLRCEFHTILRFKGVKSQRKVQLQVKVLIKHLAIFFLFPSKKFLPISFKIQLLKISPQKQKEQRQKQLGMFFFLMSFPFLNIFNSLQSSLTKFVCLLKRLQRLKQEWQKSPAGTRQTYGKIWAWFGEIERKLAKLSKPTFTYSSSS